MFQGRAKRVSCFFSRSRRTVWTFIEWRKTFIEWRKLFVIRNNLRKQNQYFVFERKIASGEVGV
jgi:hypothetical protein